MRKTLREQIENRCIHFTGIQHEECAAGIAYPLNPGGVRPKALPCFKDEVGPPCASQHFPTEEEVVAELKKHEESDQRYAAIYPLIGKIKTEHKGKDWSGVVKCPACGNNNLAIGHAALNGHVWGKCATPGCVAWME